jgi:hypothetical protein
MKIPVIAVAGVAAAAVVVGTSAVGCGKNTSTSTKSSSSTTSASSTTKASSSPTAQAGDYTGLLITGTDINVTGDTFTAQAPVLNPMGKQGVAVTFANQTDTRELGDTILVMPDAAAAAAALDAGTASVNNAVTGGNLEPAAVGAGGRIISGTTPDGSKAATLLQFTEGKAFVTLEFDSAPNDPVPPEIVTDVGQKQDAAIKAGLPG